MNKLSRAGIDLAKNVFQLHGVDRHGKAVWHWQNPRMSGCEKRVTSMGSWRANSPSWPVMT
jgi:hypothetical protein